MTREEIENILRQVEENQDLLAQASTWSVNTATDSANLNELAVNNLYVMGEAALDSLSVTSNMAIGSDMVLSSQNTDSGTANSLNTLSAPLSLQSLALAPVEIMAGKVKINTNGDVEIAGNLYVAGQIESSGVTIKENTSGNLLNLQNQAGTKVASITASGSGEFASLSTDKLIVAGADAKPQVAGINSEIETNATAGSAIIPSGTIQITIKNPSISDYTLVYITPTSSTQNSVLFVKSKGSGFFTVGFNDPLPVDVSFNWWVIEANQ